VLYYERKLKKNGFNLIVGVDEAGRGPLAGPVVAAAVALKTSRFKNRIDDSKKLTPQARQKAYLEIIKKADFGIAVVSEKVIDRVNILNATIIAMQSAVLSLLRKVRCSKGLRPHIIVDGNVKLKVDLPVTNIIRGDAKSKSIASASILAKVTRDSIMCLYDRLYPHYGFLQHKGYPTKAHRSTIKRFGPSLIHRLTFLHD